eukprot:6076930-Amphidinium_carterae.1
MRNDPTRRSYISSVDIEFNHSFGSPHQTPEDSSSSPLALQTVAAKVATAVTPQCHLITAELTNPTVKRSELCQSIR